MHFSKGFARSLNFLGRQTVQLFSHSCQQLVPFDVRETVGRVKGMRSATAPRGNIWGGSRFAFTIMRPRIHVDLMGTTFMK